MLSNTLMIQGTTSDAGKSMFVTALCRWLNRKEISVAPFKPQNMALNSGVSSDGGEIGRAQIVQAKACNIEPHSDMNPILLKPNCDIGAQVIIHGKAVGNMDATSYHKYKTIAFNSVLASYDRLLNQHRKIIVEGAGSPAEINLRNGDIANMGFAEAVDCPVIIIADIDRGGVFAHLVGTLLLLSESEQDRVVGFVINRFRGDMALLESGLRWLEERTEKPVLGVLPFFQGLYLEAEDALPCNSNNLSELTKPRLKIIVPALPRISNHTDFDNMRFHPDIDFMFVGPDQKIPSADLVILPGSKSVRADLNWLRLQGWETYLQKHLRYGGKLIGICGGFQMMGMKIFDEMGVEGNKGMSEGLGYMDFTTSLTKEKVVRNTEGYLILGNVKISGYEIHSGVSKGPALNKPATMLTHGQDGAICSRGQIFGSYLHGLFETNESLAAITSWVGLKDFKSHDEKHDTQEENFNRLADAIDKHIDTQLLNSILDI